MSFENTEQPEPGTASTSDEDLRLLVLAARLASALEQAEQQMEGVVQALTAGQSQTAPEPDQSGPPM